MKQNTYIRLLLTLLLSFGALSVKATVFFDDNFTTGSTTNGVSNPFGSGTSYDIASTKNTVGGCVINPGVFTLKLNGPTSAAWIQAQAIFTNTAVTLALPGDFIDISVTFTNNGGVNNSNLLLNSTTSLMELGLFDSGGSKPLAGDLAPGGINGTSGSAFATGNCANWKGYVSQISSNGTTLIFTRPVQNGSGTTSGNQDLVANGNGTGSFNNPGGTRVAPNPQAPIILANGGVYTYYFHISLVSSGVLSLSNALYSGTSTAGTLIYANTNAALAAGTTNITANFDGFTIAYYNKAPSGGITANPIMDITHVLINGTVSAAPAPTIVTQPVGVKVATNGATAFSVVTSGFGQTYQWHRHGTNLNAGGNISILTSPDSTTSTLFITGASQVDQQTGANGYWVTVTGVGNLSTNSVTNDLVLRPATNLTWNGNAGGSWDIDTTASWQDPAGNTTTFNYGDSVTIPADVTGTRNITLSYPYLTPSSVTFSNNQTFNMLGTGGIAGPAKVIFEGDGTTKLNEANTYTGGTIVSNANGTVFYNNLSGLGNGPVTMAGGKIQFVLTASATTGLPGDLIVAENSSFILDTSNTFAVVVLGGMYGSSGKQLQFTSPNIDRGAFPVQRIRVYGTNTTCDSDLFLDGPSTSQALYNSTVLAPYNGSGVQTYRGTISGNGGIVHRGNGLSVFAGQNTYSGGTFITAGGLGIGTNSIGSVTSGPIGTGPLFVTPEVGSGTGAGMIFSSAGAWTIANQIQWPSITNNQTLIIGGTNAITFSGAVQLNALDNPTINATNRILNVTNLALSTISGNITDGGIGCGLIKNGNGVLSLAGSDTYASNTIVLAGTLSVNGSLGGSGVLVGGSSFLGGTGTISSPVVVSNGAALAPGNSIGILTVNNNLTLNGNMLIEVNTNAAQNCDKTVVSGALTNAGTGTITITNIGTSALATGNTFFLFNKAMSNGAALTIVSPGITATWQNNLAVDGSIQVLATVPTTPTNINVTISGNTMTMTWPAAYQGWSLQSNSVSILATNSWFTVPGSSSGTSVTVNYDKTKTNVFYRMSLP